MTSRGNFKLLHGGFEFLKHYNTGNLTHWCCTKKRKMRCRGRARTQRFNEKEIVEVLGIHNHQPNDHS